MAVERLGLSLHGAREEDLMEGVIPAHPLDMQDALIEYSRKGAIINTTWMFEPRPPTPSHPGPRTPHRAGRSGTARGAAGAAPRRRGTE